MSRFLLYFFPIYGGAHLYFFLKVRRAFSPGILTTVSLSLFLILMVAAPVLVRLLEKNGLEASARFTAYSGYIWMGFLFLFFTSSLAVDLYQLILHSAEFISKNNLSIFLPSKKASLLIPIAYGLVTAIYGYYEALDIRTEHISIATPKIPASMRKLTVVQVSDVHLGLIVRKARLEKIIKAIRNASPDILVSTGDLVDGQINSMAGLAEQLNQVNPRLGKYAVTGNHEIYAGLKQAVTFTRKGGFRVLRGESCTVGELINIVGVDDPAIARIENVRLSPERELLGNLSRERFTLLLKHRPTVEKESLGLFDLQLSGHVHKGQIFPFNLLTHLSYPVRMGLSRLSQGSFLYVSRGTGTWGPPIRLLAPPEVTVIELRHLGR
jgi:predicted MPP superfamily phosphohydrolase